MASVGEITNRYSQYIGHVCHCVSVSCLHTTTDLKKKLLAHTKKDDSCIHAMEEVDDTNHGCGASCGDSTEVIS